MPRVFFVVALLILCVSFVCLEPPKLASQAKTVVAVPAGSSPVERGFSIVVDDRLGDSLAKYDEYVQAHAWDKAFRILADVPEDKWSSLQPDQQGFIRPASGRVRESILQLPADGREAYKIFFDPKARLLFAQIPSATKEQDVKIARTIYDRYFITSVGDAAADWLAQDYFERGQFADAARCWKSIFDYHPDSNLAEAKILVKRAIALYRAGLAGEFHSVQQQLARDFPGFRMNLGGREVAADNYLKELESQDILAPPTADRSPASSSGHQPSPAPGHSPVVAGPKTGGEPQRDLANASGSDAAFAGLAPPEDVHPAWQFRLLEEKDIEALEAARRNYWGMPSFSAVLPSAVSDGRRVYANWLGACFALDIASGKTVWTTHPDVKGMLSQLRANTGRMMMYTTNLAQFSLAFGATGAAGEAGVVLSVSTSSENAGRFRLVAYDAAKGSVLWSSDRTGAGTAQSFVGTPVVDGNSVFVVTHQVANDSPRRGPIVNNGNRASQFVLRHLDLRTGAELWSLPLGTPQLIGDGNWGQQFVPIPALLISGGRIYVLTNDGALLAVSLGRRQIEWAYKYEPPGNSANAQRLFRPASGVDRHILSSGPILVRDGVVYFKESMSPTLFALEESGPRLKWKWQDSEFANLVGADGDDVYLFSNELSAISRAKPETRWANRLSIDLQGVGAQVGSQAVLVFTPRGLFELSKENGDVRRIFRGTDLGPVGGYLLEAGGHLVTVSNLALTAYPGTANN